MLHLLEKILTFHEDDARIIDYAPFHRGGRPHILVLHETYGSTPQDHAVQMSCFQRTETSWTEVSSERPARSSCAIDVLCGTDELIFVALKRRGEHPLYRIAYKALGAKVSDIQTLTRNPDQLNSVRSSPKEGLFNPRFILGTLNLIANDADGHAVTLMSRSRQDVEIFDAFRPQAAYVPEKQPFTAFLRAPPNCSLPSGWPGVRNSGPPCPNPCHLFMRTPEGQEADLSADLGFGPVLDFALLSLERIYALRDGPDGGELLTLECRGDVWSITKSQTFNCTAETFRVLMHDGSPLLFACTQNATTLQCVMSP